RRDYARRGGAAGRDAGGRGDQGGAHRSERGLARAGQRVTHSALHLVWRDARSHWPDGRPCGLGRRRRIVGAASAVTVNAGSRPEGVPMRLLPQTPRGTWLLAWVVW